VSIWPSAFHRGNDGLTLIIDWRRSSAQAEERKILSLFADDPRAPYSLHNFVRHGAQACGKFPGEWFGPSATARCIQYADDMQEHGRDQG
jgi:cysteine protease ATG4